MGSYSNVPTDELVQRWKDTAEERGSMLEDNRDEDDQDHYDGSAISSTRSQMN
ncbi:MAG TPA: hypothetical protein VI837_05610 [Blastocatellia bacterium]|nr:hypothetical protein [Blastocatellia bacterium]